MSAPCTLSISEMGEYKLVGHCFERVTVLESIVKMVYIKFQSNDQSLVIMILSELSE